MAENSLYAVTSSRIGYPGGSNDYVSPAHVSYTGSFWNGGNRDTSAALRFRRYQHGVECDSILRGCGARWTWTSVQKSNKR